MIEDFGSEKQNARQKLPFRAIHPSNSAYAAT